MIKIFFVGNLSEKLSLAILQRDDVAHVVGSIDGKAFLAVVLLSYHHKTVFE